MGRTVDRHWDSRTYTSRAAESSDPPRTVFRAYVPHPINGWAPDLNAALWHQVSASTERCRELRLSTAAGSLPAGWLLERADDHACRLHERLDEHVETLLQRWATAARVQRIRPSSAAFRLLLLLPGHPVLDVGRAQELLQTNERTARHAVARLIDAGILVRRSAGRRNRVLECADMMDAFTEAAREQPADNLTLASRQSSGPNGGQPGSSEALDGGLPSLCNAAVQRRDRPRRAVRPPSSGAGPKLPGGSRAARLTGRLHMRPARPRMACCCRLDRLDLLDLPAGPLGRGSRRLRPRAGEQRRRASAGGRLGLPAGNPRLRCVHALPCGP